MAQRGAAQALHDVPHIYPAEGLLSDSVLLDSARHVRKTCFRHGAYGGLAIALLQQIDVERIQSESRLGRKGHTRGPSTAGDFVLFSPMHG